MAHSYMPPTRAHPMAPTVLRVIAAGIDIEVELDDRRLARLAADLSRFAADRLTQLATCGTDAPFP